MVIWQIPRGTLRNLTLAGILSLTSFGPVLARDEPAPVIDAATQPGMTPQQASELEKRITVLERQVDNQALLQLMTRIESLREELQSILSRVEEQGYAIESIEKRQRDLYLDIDQRLRKLEEVRTAPAAGGASQSQSATSQGFPPPAMPPSTGSSGPSSASAATTDLTDAEAQLERKAYEQAFNQLKDGRYDDAIAAFQAFVKTYPNGRYAANAQYWLGEANYVQRRFDTALAEFDKVLKNYPDSNKRADAMLKMGYTYQELGDIEQAKVTLNNLVRDYPASTAASLAKKRLQDLK